MCIFFYQGSCRHDTLMEIAAVAMEREKLKQQWQLPFSTREWERGKVAAAPRATVRPSLTTAAGK